MSSRIEELRKIRAHGCYMQEKDLAELYAYLDLFAKTYLCGHNEAVSLLDTIRQVFSLEYDCPNPDTALRKLKNPRNAGRKPLYSDAKAAVVMQLHDSGLSVRNISAQTGIPRSTVQRLLHG